MNRDYSKFLELLNKDAEKERNENAEKAVHNNLYNKGFRDGIAVLDKIRENIQFIKDKCLPNTIAEEYEQKGLQEALDIIDKYKAESEG